jgi:hypothetical protein
MALPASGCFFYSNQLALLFCSIHLKIWLPFFVGSSHGDSSKLLNVDAWQLLNQLGSEIMLQFPFVLGRREAGFYCPNIWHSPIPVWQLPEGLL